MMTILIAAAGYALLSLAVAMLIGRLLHAVSRDERARDGEAEGGGRQVQGVAVHAQGDAA